jgi:Aromatic-ring hydroxylase, C-terminal
MSGADVRYDMGGPDAHPLVGRCAPDLTLRTADGTVRLAELTRTARPLLIDLTDDSAAAKTLADGYGAVDVVTPRPSDGDTAVTALLLRPDTYVAWASAVPRPGPAELESLREAVARWFGATGPATGGGQQ